MGGAIGVGVGYGLPFFWDIRCRFDLIHDMILNVP